MPNNVKSETQEIDDGVTAQEQLSYLEWCLGSGRHPLEAFDESEATHTLTLYFPKDLCFYENIKNYTDVTGYCRVLVHNYFSILEQKLPNNSSRRRKHFFYSGSVEIAISSEGSLSASEICLYLDIPGGCEEIFIAQYKAVWRELVRSHFGDKVSASAELEEIIW